MKFNKLVVVFSLGICSITIAQSPIISSEIKKEFNKLEFQEFFFDALTQKSIKNYQNAIDNLDKCNELIPNNIGVLFELSKNYLFLKMTSESVIYANKALEIEPKNIWVLKHLVKIYKKERNFNKAINTQNKIVELNPTEKRKLVYLHLQNKDKKSAKNVLNELKEAKMLNRRLREILKKLDFNKNQTLKHNDLSKKVSLKQLFDKKKSFSNLKELLKELEHKKNDDFLNYSEKGLSLFPAQPFVYLMNGKALNQKKNFKEAITSLENGIDFIIDDTEMEINFYKELIKSYQELGNFEKVKEYQKKLK